MEWTQLHDLSECHVSCHITYIQVLHEGGAIVYTEGLQINLLWILSNRMAQEQYNEPVKLIVIKIRLVTSTMS